VNQTLSARAFIKELDKLQDGKSINLNYGSLILWGVKSLKERFKLDSFEDELYLYETVIQLIQQVTPRQFMNIFPIDKDYDGNKYDCKDYFYTIKKSKQYGLDNRITDAFEFLWDYWNRETSQFVISYMSVMSDISKKETGRSLLEEFATEQGIKTYAKKEINGETFFIENIATNSKGEII